ncbi:MAG TPA: dienelactone hydrolase family protein [Bryobacteraceae bacterium]|nr:dienelactone hydrolase family protein [Bryobacteraceae bacterium]
MNAQSVSYRDGDTSLTGFFAWDDTKHEQRPGILVVHGGAGLDDHAQGRARRLADFGLVTLACDMYGDGVAGNRERVMASIAELTGSPDRLCRRARAGMEVLASHPLVDGRLAAVGYCFGGMTVLELARDGAEIAGVASIHGSLKTTRPAQASKIKAKVLVCHGALDPHVPMAQVTAFIEEMNQAAADYQLIVYGHAMHGFTHENASQHAIPGVAYHALTDARSSAALRTFLGELFGS